MACRNTLIAGNTKPTHMKRNFTRVRTGLFAIGLLTLGTITAQTVATFNYTGTVQTWTVPPGVTSIDVSMTGAQGGSSYPSISVGGNGGLVTATLSVTPGQQLEIRVGGEGAAGSANSAGSGGYNGGAVGGLYGSIYAGGGGGGASDIRVAPYGLSDRLVVAGGGGGGAFDFNVPNSERGGNGGGLIGQAGYYNGVVSGTGYVGTGGTQSVGGIGGNYPGYCIGSNGVFGSGGAGGTCTNSGGGGGGGYFGGGGGVWAGGGGGSSYTAPTIATSVTHTAGTRTGNGQIVITAIVPLAATVSQSAFIACNGQSTASLTATPSGGTSPYFYSWAPSGGTSATASGLSAGTYTVTVTDNIGGTTTQIFTVTQPALLTASTSSTNVDCFGNANGSSTISASGGTAPFTYAWSNGGTTATITNLAGGTYNCTVTCSNGCTTTASSLVTEPSQLSATITSGSTSCSNITDGTATVSASGSVAPYNYIWSNAATASSISGLASGVYSCTITCTNGCSTTQSVTITSPTQLVATSSGSAILCNGDSSTITIGASGGTSPYSGTGAVMQVAGTYTYTVTDDNGCTSTTTVTVTEPTAIAVSSSSVNATCNGSSDGSIDLTVSGGTSPYTFNWNNGQFTTEDLTNIPAGSYSGILTDANGCQDSGTVVISEPAAIVATLNITSSVLCLADAPLTLNGATPAGGVFSGTGVNAGSFDPVVAGIGTHTITYTYTDSSGCTGSATDSINVDLCAGISSSDNQSFSVYPNPSTGMVTMKVAIVSQVTVFDAQGKLILDEKMSPENQNTIYFEENGMYLINVTDSNGNRSVQRVVITK